MKSLAHAVTTRRGFLQGSAAIAAAMLVTPAIATTGAPAFAMSWRQFVTQMQFLADELAAGRVSEVQVAWRGLHWLQLLDLNDYGYRHALEQSYESGNDFWLWQRLLKQSNLNGGMLNIEKQHPVPLHDHPGATGLLRVVSGRMKLWQFDIDQSQLNDSGQATLKRVAYRVLQAGDTAVLTPTEGNIHALQAISSDCRMLDFFIPPYRRKQRTWYQPLQDDWRNHSRIACRTVPEQEYLQS